MAGEYYRWQARNEKPKEEAAPLTGKEKVKNWLFYHRVHLIFGAAALWIAFELITGTLGIGKTLPDYQIAYAGTRPMPEETRQNLEKALEDMGEDCNGDGRVIVQINQYVKDTGESEEARQNASYNAASEAALMADMESCESYFFLLEDPDSFQAGYQILSHLDGTLPEEDETEGPWALAWKDLPLLSGLDLGTYEETVGTAQITGSGNEFVSGLYLARRGFWTEKTVENKEACDALWDLLTEGSR